MNTNKIKCMLITEYTCMAVDGWCLFPLKMWLFIKGTTFNTTKCRMITKCFWTNEIGFKGNVYHFSSVNAVNAELVIDAFCIIDCWMNASQGLNVDRLEVTVLLMYMIYNRSLHNTCVCSTILLQQAYNWQRMTYLSSLDECKHLEINK